MAPLKDEARRRQRRPEGPLREGPRPGFLILTDRALRRCRSGLLASFRRALAGRRSGRRWLLPDEWRGADPRGVARAADAACRLLSRRFAPSEAVIAKPSNIINPLAALLMALRPQARAVFLYAPLETFLISVANKGMHCRIWGRQLLEGYIRDGVVACLGFTPEDYFLQSDLQVAAIGWLAQQHLFQQLLARVGPQRLMSLDGDAMFTDPAGTIAAVGGHYGLKIDRQTAAQIAQGPAFSRHSKSGAAYSADTRAADYAQVRAAHGAEIDMVVTWAKAVAEAAELPLSQDRWATP